MPSMFKKAMLYLGLGSDEDFEAMDRSTEDPDRVRALDSSGQAVAAPARLGDPVGPVDPDDEGTRRSAASAVRPIPIEQVPKKSRRPSVVRTIPPPKSAKPHIVSPVTFNEAQEVADKFKLNQPVIVNLQQADRDLTRRLIDFASGLCYGVGGDMAKVADHVYMLTPSDVEVAPEERALLQEAGLHD